MKNFMCTRCHKRPAVIFMSRMENGQMVNEGCACSVPRNWESLRSRI